VLPGVAPITRQAVFRGQPSAAHGGDRERGSSPRPAATWSVTAHALTSTGRFRTARNKIGSLVPRSLWHGPRHSVREGKVPSKRTRRPIGYRER